MGLLLLFPSYFFLLFILFFGGGLCLMFLCFLSLFIYLLTCKIFSEHNFNYIPCVHLYSVFIIMFNHSKVLISTLLLLTNDMSEFLKTFSIEELSVFFILSLISSFIALPSFVKSLLTWIL